MNKQEREDLQNNPELYHTYLKDTYKSKIITGEKSYSEIITFLHKKYDAKRCNIDEISKSYYFISQMNALHSMQNEKLKLNKNDLNFIGFVIPSSEKNKEYYNEAINKKIILPEGFIVVLLETQTKYIASTSNRIFLEIVIEQGISEFDYKNETEAFFSYCFFMDQYYYRYGEI